MSIFTHLEWQHINMMNAVHSPEYSTLADIDRLHLATQDVADQIIFGGPIRCYTKFGITPAQVEYTQAEHEFRVGCLQEELTELKDALVANNFEETVDAIVDFIVFAIGTNYRNNRVYQSLYGYKQFNLSNAHLIIEYKNQYKISSTASLVKLLEEYIKEFESLDYTKALYYQVKLDQMISAAITFILNEYDADMILSYYERVTLANLSKELGALPKRGSFSIDLVKPEGWQAPNFIGLLN